MAQIKSEKKQKFWKISLFILLTGLLTAIICFLPLLNFAGRILCYEKPSTTADVIFPLAGNIRRNEYALKLFQNGSFKRVFFTFDRGYVERFFGFKELDPPKIAREKALETVPAENFAFCPDILNSTQEEAVKLRELMQENRYKSVLLVTSCFHSRRAAITIQNELGNDFQVYMRYVPPEQDDYVINGWYKHKRSTISVIQEYLKFINYYLLKKY
jgi:uncharacterized SAM-binding protein YcdF (DUF218 family)